MDVAGENMCCWLRKDTLVLAEDYIDFCTGIQQTAPCKAAEAMRRMAKELERQNHERFQALSRSFLSTCGPNSDLNACLRGIMAVLVEDGKLNWGRVVSLFAFTGVVASELFSRGDGPGSYRALACTIADYLGMEQRDWLLQNEGWEGFCKFVQRAESNSHESSMKTALFAAAGVGLAGLTFLLVR